ncbi:MAG: hypothetical protein M1824_003978 [Vezdaea acicularis]|nr:MAG: hypothetical protein M1824_003978 [Vezdaea acicularis]
MVKSFQTSISQAEFAKLGTVASRVAQYSQASVEATSEKSRPRSRILRTIKAIRDSSNKAPELNTRSGYGRRKDASFASPAARTLHEYGSTDEAYRRDKSWEYKKKGVYRHQLSSPGLVRNKPSVFLEGPENGTRTSLRSHPLDEEAKLQARHSTTGNVRCNLVTAENRIPDFGTNEAYGWAGESLRSCASTVMIDPNAKNTGHRDEGSYLTYAGFNFPLPPRGLKVSKSLSLLRNKSQDPSMYRQTKSHDEARLEEQQWRLREIDIHYTPIAGGGFTEQDLEDDYRTIFCSADDDNSSSSTNDYSSSNSKWPRLRHCRPINGQQPRFMLEDGDLDDLENLALTDQPRVEDDAPLGTEKAFLNHLEVGQLLAPTLSEYQRASCTHNGADSLGRTIESRSKASKRDHRKFSRSTIDDYLEKNYSNAYGSDFTTSDTLDERPEMFEDFSDDMVSGGNQLAEANRGAYASQASRDSNSVTDKTLSRRRLKRTSKRPATPFMLPAMPLYNFKGFTQNREQIPSPESSRAPGSRGPLFVSTTPLNSPPTNRSPSRWSAKSSPDQFETPNSAEKPDWFTRLNRPVVSWTFEDKWRMRRRSSQPSLSRYSPPKGIAHLTPTAKRRMPDVSEAHSVHELDTIFVHPSMARPSLDENMNRWRELGGGSGEAPKSATDTPWDTRIRGLNVVVYFEGGEEVSVRAEVGKKSWPGSPTRQ